jgi:hypothetical protein
MTEIRSTSDKRYKDYLNIQLAESVMFENLDHIKELIHTGADVNTRYTGGETPLLMAIKNNKLMAADLLIESGADVDIGDMDANTPLMVLCRSNSAMDLTKKVVALTNKISAKNNLGDTALHISAYHGYFETVEELVKNGAELNMPDRAGDLPLHKTAVYGWTEIAKYLVENGADVEWDNKDGNTALHLAYLNGFDDFIQFIESISTSGDKRNNNGRIPAECRTERLKYKLAEEGKDLMDQAARYVKILGGK